MRKGWRHTGLPGDIGHGDAERAVIADHPQRRIDKRLSKGSGRHELTPILIQGEAGAKGLKKERWNARGACLASSASRRLESRTTLLDFLVAGPAPFGTVESFYVSYGIRK